MSFYGSELSIDDNGLSMYGENTARLLRISGRASVSRITLELKSQLRELRNRAAELEKVCSGKPMPPAAQWLTDNMFLISGEGAKAAEELDLSWRLPAEKGLPAVYCLCQRLVRCGGGRLTEERCRLFFRGCQNAYVLSSREISLLTAMLRAALISELHDLYTVGTLTSEAAAVTEAVVTSLRVFSTLDMSQTLEDIDKVEQLYRQDPQGVYPLMSEESRALYKRQTARLARARGVSELRIAEKVLHLSKSARDEGSHIGHWIFTKPLGKPLHRHSQPLYICTVVLLTAFLSLLCASFIDLPIAAALLLLPMWEIVKTVLDTVILHMIPPAEIPRLELDGGLPREGRCICVISALLTSPQSGEKLARRLEEYRLANRDSGKNLLFGILGDLPDAAEAVTERDAEILENAKAAVDCLNARYGGGFFLLIRDRAYNSSDKKYMAHERKRGAIAELAKRLSGKESSIKILSGSELSLRGIRYILTLDEDTRLTPDSARQLVGAMLHPLNKPVTGKKGAVIRGHGIIQPRISTELSCMDKSGFAAVFGGQGGCDPYGCHCSELYMDAFENGGFAGKGVIDVKCFMKVMEGRIPENRVLSHDALEGAYLRGGLMTDVELTDSFPSDAAAYFKRMHRWVRGDWQNSPWLFRRGGSFSPIDRFRLFDSLRRSIFPVSCLVNLMLALFMGTREMRAVGLLSLLAMGLKLIFAFISGLFKDREVARRRFRSRIIRGFNAVYMRFLVGLVLLPFEAWTCLSAAVTALWRMLISKKNLLSWTPASAFDGIKQGPVKYFLTMWPAFLMGLALLIFSPSPLGKAAGIVWLVSPAFALALSGGGRKRPALNTEDTRWLLAKSVQIWSFFKDFCTPADHFLPPDNFQEKPNVGVAHRTSPTNIGLCLLSCLAALDLGIARREEALGLAENLLATLRRLPKWNGHLYNWYDTQSLKPLRPAYVSTVDSGNLAACLIIMAEGLRELEQDALAQQCSQLLAPMSFAPFYDSKRRLFSIGMDTEKNRLSSSYYDLMASEARTASFVAIASGDVPRRHWRFLSRAQVSQGGLCGMVSWTGSMFEYLMPSLFLPSLRGSIIYETERFCADIQRRRTEKLKKPWGISESAYYSLDPALSYRYKAHGCGVLALKKGMDEELVISPYSSFLTLCCRPAASVANLKRLEREGGACKYGLWEAIDFTPCRTEGNEGRVVRCVMAHHLGMSLIAIANRLCQNPMPRRLMKNPVMSAYGGLLEERLPLEAPLIRRREEKPHEAPPRSTTVFWERRGDFADPAAPECCLLSNGSYSLLMDNLGLTRPRWNGITPYLCPKTPDRPSHGMDLWLVKDGELINLLPSPSDGDDVKSSWEFTFYGAKISTQRGQLRSQVTVCVSNDYNGEKRRVSVDGPSGERRSCRLLIGLKPVLAPYNDYINHPAFYGLGLEAGSSNGMAVIRRLKRGNTPESFMCLAASEPLECSFSGDDMPGRGGLASALEQSMPSFQGWLSNPCIHACLDLHVQSGSGSAVTIALAMGATREEAESAAQHILAEGDASGEPFAALNVKALGMNEKQVELAMELLRSISFPEPRDVSAPRSELWRFGISGDLPIICRETGDEAGLEDAGNLITAHSLLCTLGRPFDLAFITDEGGDYLRPFATALEKLKKQSGDSGLIRILDRSQDVSAVLAYGCRPPERPLSRGASYRLTENTAAPRQGIPTWCYNDDGSFTFNVNRSLPPKAWGNMLTNGRFGFFATDCGTGHMWYGNAREYHINRWLCDSLAVEGTETLTLNGETAFASPYDENCRVTFGFGFARWEKATENFSSRLEAFVPIDTDCRVLVLSWDGGPIDVEWYTDLVLGGEATPSGSVAVTEDNGLFTARNPDSPFPGHPFTVCSNIKADFVYTRRRDFLTKAPGIGGAADCLALGFKGAESPLVLVCGCDEAESLRALASFAAAEREMRHTTGLWGEKVTQLKIETPLPSLDRLINGWLPYQALACRLMGRCSVYQSGGAMGFRDQLQDSVNLILLDPKYAKEQILLCCRRQYREGDVMHWWHDLEGSSKGVRTRCSDDLLWLPWALCEYTEKTGDLSLCEKTEPWLESRPLEDGEGDRYEDVRFSEDSGTVLEHCLRAVNLVIERGTGPHGLLKMGGGDWNDGMNLVGSGGDGESVWLSWFFAHTGRRLARLLERLGHGGEAASILSEAEKAGRQADSAWDGAWYLRGWFDDGTPLGGSGSVCCRMDSIAQSFAALCPEADRGRLDTALTSAFERLFRREDGVTLLFDPPFENAQPSPGYIESYGPGFRENGGQYTHAAVWLAMALLKTRRPREALELIEALIPEDKPTEIYKGEPYVLAADVYSNPGHMGQAGWTWYTGAAGWLWRVVTEELLGIRLRDGELSVNPLLPEEWKSRRLRVSLKGKKLLDTSPDSEC